MTDMSKYKNVSLTKETYSTLDKLSKVILPDAKLSISKTIESIANEKAKKLNGKIKKGRVKVFCDGATEMDMSELQRLMVTQV